MALRGAFSELAVDAVEPDCETADIAARFFGVPRCGARLQHHLTSGAAFLADHRHIGQVRCGSAHVGASFAARPPCWPCSSLDDYAHAPACDLSEGLQMGL